MNTFLSIQSSILESFIKEGSVSLKYFTPTGEFLIKTNKKFELISLYGNFVNKVGRSILTINPEESKFTFTPNISFKPSFSIQSIAIQNNEKLWLFEQNVPMMYKNSLIVFNGIKTKQSYSISTKISHPFKYKATSFETIGIIGPLCSITISINNPKFNIISSFQPQSVIFQVNTKHQLRDKIPTEFFGKIDIFDKKIKSFQLATTSKYSIFELGALYDPSKHAFSSKFGACFPFANFGFEFDSHKKNHFKTGVSFNYKDVDIILSTKDISLFRLSASVSLGDNTFTSGIQYDRNGSQKPLFEFSALLTNPN